jgi:hypothetical protein
MVGCRVESVPAPVTVPGILGAIRVEYVSSPVVDGDSVWGAYHPATRRILVDRNASPLFRRNIIAHERCHSALADVGVELDADKEEQVCNAIALLEARR